jgi:uncharacterized membrane protein YhaH (DUF805 family)
MCLSLVYLLVTGIFLPVTNHPEAISISAVVVVIIDMLGLALFFVSYAVVVQPLHI